VNQQGVRTLLEEIEDDGMGDWMRCVGKEDERRNDIFLNKQQDDYPKVFQLDTNKVEKLAKPQPTINHHNNNDSC
jgi:hypothetical protein